MKKYLVSYHLVMDIIVRRFPTLAVNIINNLDDKSLVKFKDINRENHEFMDQERFYWIRILRKYSKYFETNKESWMMSISKIQARFVKKLAMATLNFFKTAPRDLEDVIDVHLKIFFFPREDQLTPLLIAAYNVDLSFFQQVKERTTNLKPPMTESDASPIHLAAFGGHITLCRHLLVELENKNSITKNGLTTLDYAAVAGHLEVFKIFHEVAEVKNPKSARTQKTPLHFAAEKGHSEICKFIIEREDDKNPADRWSRTPFHLAAQYGQLSTCSIIMNNVTNKNPVNIGGMTPLNLAALYGQLETFKLIFRSNIEKNSRNIVDGTSFHCAAMSGNFDLCKYILENIAEKNPLNHNGDTPLHYAALGGHLNVCKLIMANIDALEIKNLQNQTPMDIGKEDNHVPSALIITRGLYISYPTFQCGL